MSIPRLLLAVVLGAIVLQVWGTVSYMALGWHMTPIKPVENEAEVAAVLKKNAPEHSMFLMPHPDKLPEGAEPHGPESMDNWNRGPIFFGVIRPGEFEFRMGAAIGKTFATNLASAFIIAILLAAAANGLNYLGRVGFTMLAGLFAGIFSHVPYHIWWEFPVSFVVPNVIDAAVHWLLAGLVMAALIKPSAA